MLDLSQMATSCIIITGDIFVWRSSTATGNSFFLSICFPCQVCELGRQLEEERSCCEDLVRRDRQEVLQYFETLEAALARKKRAFLDALDKAAADVSEAFDPLIDRVKELQVGVCVNVKWNFMTQEC